MNLLTFSYDADIWKVCNYCFHTGVTRVLKSLAGCRTMFLFAAFCKIGAWESNAYSFHIKLSFIVVFGQFRRQSVMDQPC